MSTSQKIKDIATPTPVNRKSRFEFDELFFSITDPKSTITYANEIFVRVSCYDRDEIIGQLHKLIRHPDMPRSVFKIFWDHLKANKPVAAYVKNLAKDGSYYWVMALAFPCKGGYLSIRLKPGSGLFKKVKRIYADTLHLEKREEKERGKRKAMLYAEEHLLKLLENEGFASYDEFMWKALQIEMQYREEKITHMGTSSDRNEDEEIDIPPALLELEPLLRKLVTSLESLTEIHQGLVQHSDYILELARSILLLSLNTQISSVKLDQENMALSVIAEKMGERSLDGEKKLVGMKNNIQQLNELIRELNFDIVSSKLQVEMTIDFLKEVASQSLKRHSAKLTTDEIIKLLHDAFMPRLESIATGLGHLPNHLRNLLSDVTAIERLLLVLRFVHTTGKVEIARLKDNDASFTNTFQDLMREIETAQEHLDELSDLIQEHEQTGTMYSNMQKDVRRLADKINYKSVL